MAVLKSLFGIRNKFEWRSDAVSAIVRLPQSVTSLPLLLAGAALFFAASIAMGFGVAQKAAIAGTTSRTASDQGSSQQAIDLVNQGNVLLERNDFSGAEAAFRKATQAYPSFAEAHRGLGIALWRQGQLGPAWQEFSTVVRLEPASAQARFELGQLAWQIYSSSAGKAAATTGLSPDDFPSLALSEVEKAVSLNPRDFKMRLELSEMELELGRKKQAQADALGAVPLATSALERSLAHVALARVLMATGDEMRAEAEYKKAIAENPASGSAYLGLGEISLFQHNVAEAEKYFRQAIQVSPGLGLAYAALAKLLVGANQSREALAMLQKAVTLDPEDWQSQYQLAKLEIEAGETAHAEELFKKVFTAQPNYLPAGEQLALMHLRQGDVQGAIRRAQTLVARNPQAAEGHRVLALAFWRERQTDASLAECALALGAEPQSTPMLALQALELWHTKRRRDAQCTLRVLAHRNPGIFSAVTFCQLIVCGSADVPLVGEFLRKYRWILEPPDTQ